MIWAQKRVRSRSSSSSARVHASRAVANSPRKVERDPRQEQCFHEHAGVAGLFGERHRLASQIRAEKQVGADEVPDPHPPHDGEALPRLPDPLAQLPGAGEDRPDLRGGIPVRRDIRSAQRVQELQLEGVALRRFVERAEQLQALGQVADRLDVRTPLLRPQPRFEPVADCLLGQARLGEVVGEQLRLRLDDLRELALPAPRRSAGGTAAACP